MLRGWVLTEKERKGDFRDEIVFYLDPGGGYMGVCTIKKIIELHTSALCCTACILGFNTKQNILNAHWLH